MTQIKREKAKEYAESAAFSPGGISYTLTYGDAYDGFIAGYEAVETEAEERHAKELQGFKNYIESILDVIDNADHLCEVKRFVELNADFTEKLNKQ